MNKNLPKCLITGASGFLGRELVEAAKERYKVYVTSKKTVMPDKECLYGKCDLTSYSEMLSMIEQVKPEIVYHLAALSQPNSCAENPSYSEKINYEASVNLAGVCADRGIKFVFTSTDLVFDGKKAPYREEDSVNPISHYAEHKIMAEEEILNKSENSLICRLPLMFGRETILSMMEVLDKGEKLRLFEDEFRTPLSNVNAARALIDAADLKGLYHFGGKQRVSRLDMGSRAALILGRDQKNIISCFQKDIKMSAARPEDVSLDSTKAEEEGIKLMGYDESLLKMFKLQ